MAEIIPFSAWRYNEERIKDINLKFSPLFDVVSPAQLEALYGIPNNSIHLSVPRSHDDALAKLSEWKENGVIRQDPLPGIYIYYQVFRLFGEIREYVRKGFVCMVRLNGDPRDAKSDIVLHEDTLTHSVEERTALLRKTMLNVAPTHGLYEDEDFSLEPLMDAYMEHPLYEYIDYQGVINKLAIVQDPRDIARFTALIAARKIFLADGHHRLASSLALQQQYLAEGRLQDESMVNYHLMYLTNLRADDLRILPIHRVLHLEAQLTDEAALLARFAPWFDVQDVSQHRSPLHEELRRHKRAFGLVTGERQYLLRLRDSVDPVAENDLPSPEAVKRLDYTVLHYFVFDRIFGIPYREQGRSERISYQKDMSAAIKIAMRDPEYVAFLTPELSMEQMMEVCRTGALMPQKSTYFYPKVVCGLVFASIDDHENDSPFDIGFRKPEA